VCALLFLISMLYGCGELVQCKRYNPFFILNEPIHLEIELEDADKIHALFEASGFVINPKSSLHIKLTTNPLQSSCAMNASHVAKEHFVRISAYKNEEEQYRIQMNSKTRIGLEDIERMIKKMKSEIGK